MDIFPSRVKKFLGGGTLFYHYKIRLCPFNHLGICPSCAVAIGLQLSPTKRKGERGYMKSDKSVYQKACQIESLEP
ncbi:MAG: hypothetical protein C5S47_04030 [Candidatus Methanogasteraceae archaeon]|nr:MAG: hypothetical protein C5S47_04030 [ANME-2 cluster archaeon]